MKTNKEVIQLALKHKGQGGSKFRKFAGLPSGAAWCNAFVDYVAQEGGVSALYFNSKKETYCPHSIKWCQSNLAQIPLYLALPADIIYFDWEKNGVPNHIGLVKAHKSTSAIYTVEGNTNGGVVAEKTRAGKYVQAVFRPHYKPTVHLGQLTIDGSFGYKSIANLQRALGGCTVDGVLGKDTVKRLQHYLALKEDGSWGTKTSKAVQKLVGVKQDGEFGPASVKALQKWINKKNTKSDPAPAPEPKPQTNADKIVASAKNLAWAYGTAKSKWAYKGGSPTTKCKTAMKKYGYDTKKKMSDCGNFINTVVRESGVNTHFVAQKAKKKPFPANENFDIVFKGKAVPDSVLKAGDIIRYKKTSGQHTLMYIGGGRLCDAGIYNRFGHIYINDHRYNKSNVKKSTIQVLRAR